MVLDVGDARSSKNKRKSKQQEDSESHEIFKSYGMVYANDLASRAYTGTKPQAFPVGSILVREKLSEPDAKPELLAVMIKRERGFNPAGGDWLFLTVKGDLSEVKNRKKKGECLDCHKSARETDFVFPSK